MVGGLGGRDVDGMWVEISTDRFVKQVIGFTRIEYLLCIHVFFC